MEGRYTQNPCSGHFERYGDLSPTEEIIMDSLVLGVHFGAADKATAE